MSLIEGIGDEVTIIFGILLLVLLLTIAWISTHTRDIPFFSLVIVEISQRAERRQAQQSSSNSQQSQQLETEDRESRESSSSPDQQGDVEEEVHKNSESSNESATVASSDKIGDTQSEQSKEAGCHPNNESDEVKTDNSIHEEEFEKETEPELVQNSEQKCENSSSNITVPRDVPKPDITSSSSAPETELRQRRLAFFEQSKSSSDKREISGNVVGRSMENDSETSAKVSQESTVSPPHPTLRTDKNDSEKSRHTSKSKDKTNEQAEPTNTSDMDGSIRVRLKYLNDSQRLVIAKPDDTIAQFRRQNFAEELEQNKLIRFIFNGQEMRDDSYSLQSYNIGDNSVIHCLITQSVPQDQNQTDEIEVDFDIGSLMFPLFAIVLGLIWFTRISYRQYFNATSTVSLIAITFLFLVAYASTFRRNQNHVHVD